MDLSIIILLSLMPVLVITAGLKDLTTMTIPNWISLGLVAAFVPAAAAVGLSPLEFAMHFAIGFAALVVGAGLFALRFIGGGDAKLLAAVCLWMGLSGSAAFLLITAVVGGLFSLSLLAVRGVPGIQAFGGPSWVYSLLEPRGDIPYGVAIAAGALIAFPYSAMVQAFIGA